MSENFNMKMHQAIELRNARRYQESLALFEQCVAEADTVESKMFAANEVVETMRRMFLELPEQKPAQGSSEYAGIHNYLRVLVESYQRANPIAQENVKISDGMQMLSSEDSSPLMDALEEATMARMGLRDKITRDLRAVSGEFPEGQAEFALKTDKFEEFRQKMNFAKYAAFSIYDARVVDEARRLAQQYRHTMTILDKPAKMIELYYVPGKERGSSSNAEAKTGPCFIATAVYGSPLAPEVEVFRQFRDETLLSSKLGTLFVRTYYSFSPPLAFLVSKMQFLKSITRLFLLDPILLLLKTHSKFK